MASSSSIFSGGSRYSQDFQAVIDRSVAIASLPLEQLRSGKTTLEIQSSALSTLDSKFSSLEAAITSLSSATGLSSYNTSVSNGAVLKSTVSEGALAGTYSLEVTSLGSYSNSMSKSGLIAVSDPETENISAASSFTLNVGGDIHVITPETGTLNSLVAAINDADADVNATIVNVGSTASPDYRLSLQSTKLGAVAISLSDGSELLDTLSTGALASYKVNGGATDISSDSRTITLSPGLTVALLAQSEAGEATTITVSRGTTAISNALSSLVNAYNAATVEIDKHRGTGGGALAGQSILSTLGQALRDLTHHSDDGALASLTELGLSFDSNGVLSFDAAAFSALSFDDVSDFLGTTTGEGFLKAATDILSGLRDAEEGVISSAISSVTDQIESQDDLIVDYETRIEDLRANLTLRIAAADALIASLEQQVLYFTGLFEAQAEARRQ